MRSKGACARWENGISGAHQGEYFDERKFRLYRHREPLQILDLLDHPHHLALLVLGVFLRARSDAGGDPVLLLRRRGDAVVSRRERHVVAVHDAVLLLHAPLHVRVRRVCHERGQVSSVDYADRLGDKGPRRPAHRLGR